jgi:hypothetical protein
MISTVLLATAALLLADSPPRRLSAEFQNSTSVGGEEFGEVFTNAAALPAGAGGTVVYSKTLRLPADVDVLYITFSGQGDTHNGSALLMNASVDGTLIQPLLGQTLPGGGGTHVQTGWYTLLHVPAATLGGVTNCNDGGGGPADCHDNTIYFSGCARVDAKPTKPVTVTIKLADLPGGDNNFAFYERATIYIDGQHDSDGSLCQAVGTSPH